MAIAMIKIAAVILYIASLHRRCRSVKIEREETNFFKSVTWSKVSESVSGTNEIASPGCHAPKSRLVATLSSERE